MGDRNAFQCRYLELYRALSDDIRSWNLPFPVLSDESYLAKRLANEGSSFIYGSLPLLGRALDEALSTGVFHPPHAFACVKGTKIPIFLRKGFECLLHSDGILRTDSSPLAIQALRQLLLFDGKAERPFTKEQLSSFEEKFADQQASLRKICLSNLDSKVIDLATKLIGDALKSIPIQSFALSPKHGPGATAEGHDFVSKWEFNEWPRKLERHFPFGQYGELNMSFGVSRRNTGVRLTSKLTTRACFVPKDFRGPRLISIEPTAMQYVQQGMLRWLNDAIKRTPIGRSVDLNDQRLNQEAARLAFASEQCTVDLSSASDGLSAVLVWRLFSQLPDLRRLLFHLRSDFVGFPTRSVRLVAFAPMGSAICFPVQSICFWAIALATTMCVLGIGQRRASRLVHVYGDDIIIPTAAYSMFRTTCDLVGLRINEHKTCYQTPFRESCGKEYWAGDDVAIVRNRYYDYVDRTLTQHPVLRNLQRQFYCLGYRKTARVLLRWCREIFPTAICRPDGHADESLYCFAEERYNPSLLRYDKDLQCMLFRVPVEMVKSQRWNEEDDHLGLTASLISSAYLPRFAVRHRTTVKTVWRRANGLETVR